MKITFRSAARNDIPAILALHERQQSLQGTNFEAPPFDGRSIVDCVVGEVDSGEIIGCYYVEAVAELRFVAIDPMFTAAAQREVEGLTQRLRGAGIRYLECFVPQSLKHLIGKPLQRAGFEDKTAELAYFSKDLREGL